MSNRFCRIRLLCILSLFFIAIPLTLFAGGAKDEQPVPEAGPWLEFEDDYFVYIYKEADIPFLQEVHAVAKDCWHIATGYLKHVPQHKPRIILYGTQDSPAFGGFYGYEPGQIGLVATDSQLFGANTLLTHELTHYLQADRRDSGDMMNFAGFFWPMMARSWSVVSSDLSLEGTTSFLDGYRRSERSTVSIRAAVLEGRMWNWNQISNAGVRSPGALRVYLSGMLIQDWLFDKLGPDAVVWLQEEKGRGLANIESNAFQTLTGLNIETVWGDIRADLAKKYAFAEALPLGLQRTPRDPNYQPRWQLIQNSQQGILQYRGSLTEVPSLGFWRPNEQEELPPSLFPAFSTGPNNLLIPDPGTFIPLRGLISSEASVSSDATKVAAILTEPAKSTLYHAPNRTRLVLADIHWSQDAKSATAKNIRYMQGRGFASPVLSPDAKSLYALRRLSSSFELVQLDMHSGAASVLPFPEGLHPSSIRISPDGTKLAVSCQSKASYNVGVYYIEEKRFELITDDSAMDLDAHFSEDGRFLFSSDRENTLIVYGWDGETFYRELTDRIGAMYTVRDGNGMVYYNSWSADGAVVRQQPVANTNAEPISVEQFAALSPDWVARRDMIYETYRKAGQLLADIKPGNNLSSFVKDYFGVKNTAAAATPVTDTERQNSTAENTDTPLSFPRKHAKNLARLITWLPFVARTGEGYRAGLLLQGMNHLGTTTWGVLPQWIQDSNQIGFEFILTQNFPDFSLSGVYAQDYSTVYDSSDSSIEYLHFRDYSLQAAIPLVRYRSPAAVGFTLNANIAGVLREEVRKDQSFDIVYAFSTNPERAYGVNAGLNTTLSAPSVSASLFGPSFLSASVNGVFTQPLEEAAPLWGLVGGLSAQAANEGLHIRGDIRGAWRQTGSAYKLLPRAVNRWNIASTAPLRLELGASFGRWLIGMENGYLMVSNDVSGEEFSAKTFFEVDTNGVFSWSEQLQLEYRLAFRFNTYYNAQILQFGIAYNNSVDNYFNASASNFAVSVTVMNQSMYFSKFER